MLIRGLTALGASLLSFAMLVAPARADGALFTFGEMARLQTLPLQSSEREVSEEDVILSQHFELYAYTVFEALEVANDAAVLINREPLFCAPSGVFRFKQEGDITRLAGHLTHELIALTEELGDPLERYGDQPASLVLLLGLRAAFPCADETPQLAQR